MKKTSANAEFIAKIEKMNKQEVFDLLEEKVTEINETSDDEKKIELNVECAELCKKYNELSMLSVYGVCAKAEKPVLEFAQTYYYPTVSTKDELSEDLDNDGRKSTKVVRTINEGEKRLDLFDFLRWAEKCNKVVTAEKYWRSACEGTRNSIETEWKGFFNSTGESRKINVGTIKKNLQAMFDALIFIEAPSGKNAVIATGATARYLFGFANVRKDGRTKDGEIKINKTVLSTKQWVTLVMDALHETVKDKDYAPKEFLMEYGSEEKTKDGDATVTEATAEDMAK